MARKVEPEEAFRLIDHRGVKNRPLNLGQKIEGISAEDEMDGKPAEAPKWIRYTIIAVAITLSVGFIGILISGAYLVYNQNAPTSKAISPDEPLIIYSEEESKNLITITLKKFLNCINTEERIDYVMSPDSERSRMINYYEKRGNLDVALWKVKLIKPATLDGARIWMVAYLDVKKNLRYMSLMRSGNQFLIQWSASVGYSELSWDQFTIKQPRKPIQMRCYALRNIGAVPANFDSSTHYGFIIENRRGDFTKFAIMPHSSEGARLLNSIPVGSRNPVNLLLKYIDQPNGTRQLVIDKLIHFQWYQNTITNKGRPVELRD